jgi:uncharacterized protein
MAKGNTNGSMHSCQHIIIFGASVRAAAFSALRAGLNPWCVDLFADADLRARCSATQIPSSLYPQGFVAYSDQAPPGPWMYTGGLENHPVLVDDIGSKRPLWGNNGRTLALVRSPSALAEISQANDIPFPTIYERLGDVPPDGRCLLKPRTGSGGAGIHFLEVSKAQKELSKETYLQELIEGVPCSAVYVGDEKDTCFLGATRQLVGESWLHASRFHYCGSIGPLDLNPPVRQTLEKIGHVLGNQCNLRGLFGVDFILAGGIPWSIEVNPRYPASVEILEYALGIKAIAYHRMAFDAGVAIPDPVSKPVRIMGKAILFAKTSLKFPPHGPWASSLARPKSLAEAPDFADIPSSGRIIKAGKPILTLFCQSASVQGCIDNLKDLAQDLDHYLWKT